MDTLTFESIQKLNKKATSWSKVGAAFLVSNQVILMQQLRNARRKRV